MYIVFINTCICYIKKYHHCSSRIKADWTKIVDSNIPNMNLAAFQKPFLKPEVPDLNTSTSSSTSTQNSVPVSQSTEDAHMAMQHKHDDRGADSKSLTSLDSGIGPSQNADGVSSPEKDEKLKQETQAKEVMTSTVKTDSNTADGTEIVLNYSMQTLEDLDKHTGVLHVYYLVLEGLSSTASACPKNYQPQTLEMFFELLRSAAKVPGMFHVRYMDNIRLHVYQLYTSIISSIILSYYFPNLPLYGYACVRS